MKRPSLTYANVMSTLGVFIALGGTSYAVARNSVGNRQLKASAVTSGKIRNRTIKLIDLAPGVASSRRGPRGATGPAGGPGPAGPAGPPGPAEAEAWKVLPFMNGWDNYGTYETGAYRKDQLGIVHLRGLITHAGSPPAAGAIIAFLPAGYRPRRARIFVVHTGEPNQVGRVDVGPDGRVVWSSGANTDPNSNYTSLETVAFDLD